jgi:WD40 repeat protein
MHVTGTKVVERSLTDGKPVTELGISPPPRASDGIPSMTVSRDGTRVAVVEGPTVRVTDLKTGKHLTEDHLGERINPGPPVFSADGKRLAIWSSWGNWVRVYDVTAGRKLRILDGGNAVPTAAAFSPDGARLAVGYRDGTGLVWDLTAK